MPANTYSRVYHNDGACPCFLTIPSERMAAFCHRFIDVVQKDSPGKTFGFSKGIQNISCFDLDAAVSSLGGDKQCSMDCIIRIGDYDAVHSRFSNPKCLLVEFKLNSTSALKDLDDLKKKVKATEYGLTGVNLDTTRNFIYPEGVYPLKKNYFTNWKRGSDGNSYR